MIRPRKVVFTNLGRDAGEAHIENHTVMVDLRDPFSNPIDTYLHECLHLEHPEWSEARVARTARAATRRLAQHDAAALLRLIARRGVVWEADGMDE
jgi:hypothetical protein